MSRTARQALCVIVLFLSSPALANAAEGYFDIPEQRADLALTAFAQQAQLVVFFPFEEISRVTANRLVGQYSVDEGVKILLRDTGLTAHIEVGRQLVVRVYADEEGDKMKSRGRKGLFASVMAGLAAMVGPGGSARAQTPADTALEEVTVTGSRIRDTGMNTPVPVTAVTAEQMNLAAPGSLIDALDQMPQFLGNSGPGTDVFIGTSAGQSILNMRGLGANRTLVLVDGRRIVPSTNQGTLDINVLPESMIKRVEVVTGGASAAYGTDAVAGVTNFILDTDFTGIKGHVQGGRTSRGDNDNQEASLGFGGALGERAHFVASVDYFKSDAVETYDGRNWMQDWGTVTNPAWPAQGPQLLTRPHVTSTLYTFGGLINQPGSALNRRMFLADGSSTPFVLGNPAALGGTQSQSGGIGDNLERDRAADGGLVPNVERYSAFAHVKVDLNDHFQAFGQVILGHNNVDGVGFAPVMNGPWQATIYRDNAFLPDDLRQIMVNENLSSFGFSRAGSSADISVSRLEQSNLTQSYTVGIKGDLNDWRVNSYYQYGRNENEMRALNFSRTDHLFSALDAVVDSSTGTIKCRRTLVDPSFACVPINLFGPGRASPEAIAYVTEGVKTANDVNTQHALEFTVDGEILKTRSAGPVSLAFGAAYRRDKLTQSVYDPSNPTNSPTFVAVPFNNPSLGIQGIPPGFAGMSSGVQFSGLPDFSGAISVKELFSEALVPLLKDVTLVKQLNLSAAARWAGYSGSGGVWSWKTGLDWQAIDAVRLRGTVSRDVRAANMSERFNASGGGGTVSDPLFGNQVVTFSQISGGNSEVPPEVADTRTFGVVIQPPFVEGLSMSVDWYSITLNGAIGQLGAQRIVNDCTLGATQLCDLITRDPVTNQITSLRNVYLNINAAKVIGTDVELDYQTNFGGGRSLNVRLLGSWLEEDSTTNSGAPKQDRAGDTGGQAGSRAFPDLQLVGSAIYRQGPFTAFLQERFIGKGKRSYNGNRPDLGGLTIDNNTVSPVYYTDLNLAYHFDVRRSDLELFGNITNLFDRDPPIVANSSSFSGSTPTNANLFDVLGRRFVVGLRFSY
ncbi:MAG: TonB-dependent receptor [Gammaproteobacteria bacterium]